MVVSPGHAYYKNVFSPCFCTMLKLNQGQLGSVVYGFFPPIVEAPFLINFYPGVFLDFFFGGTYQSQCRFQSFNMKRVSRQDLGVKFLVKRPKNSVFLL